ncbi:MAG TPA: TIGR02679 domain-containing protein, partial [Symbiobacteriaceae bacterium]|nr:TIGR02679 domain-containing protein [Symbiobacteriaceae bacterium]
MKSKAADYFRRRPFGRIMDLLRKRFIELGDTGGTVAVGDPTKEELAALRDFFGSPPRRRADGSVMLSLRAFESELLERSAFPCTLREALEAYFGMAIVTRKESRADEAARWEAFQAAVGAPPELAPFVAGLAPEWRQHGAALQESLALVFSALADLPVRRGATERLPVFANRIAGDPHALDGDRLAGRLLVRALSAVLPI